MFHSTNVFYLDIFATLLTNKIYNMKKIMTILSVALFAFAITISSCNTDSAESSSECAAECAKECCLGCKATDGESNCKEDHSCCAPSDDNATDATPCCCGDETCDGSCHDKSDAAPCCCGDDTCDGSCHANADAVPCCCGDETCDGSCHANDEDKEYSKDHNHDDHDH
tara:strand:- start:241 stop:747 length:507 start_codon:yes stop_codon:yes gene_type:complete